MLVSGVLQTGDQCSGKLKIRKDIKTGDGEIKQKVMLSDEDIGYKQCFWSMAWIPRNRSDS